MPTVKVIYSRNHHISAPILRTVMWSPWCHEAVIMGDELGEHVIDATFFHNVARRPLIDITSDASLYSIREFDVPNPKKTYDFLRRQLGKKYDTLGVFGIGLHREWSTPDRWFCSEISEAALEAGGLSRFKAEYVRRVTPMHSWMNTAGVLQDTTYLD